MYNLKGDQSPVWYHLLSPNRQYNLSVNSSLLTLSRCLGGVRAEGRQIRQTKHWTRNCLQTEPIIPTLDLDCLRIIKGCVYCISVLSLYKSCFIQTLIPLVKMETDHTT